LNDCTTTGVKRKKVDRQQGISQEGLPKDVFKGKV